MALKTEKVIKAFGGRRKLAEALKVSVQAVQQWGEFVPELREFQLEKHFEAQFNEASDTNN